MLRALLTIAGACVVGGGMGAAQYAASISGYTEEFVGTNQTVAEAAGRYEAAESKGTPKIVVEGGVEHNFGTMLHGESKSHEFVVMNAGTGPLVLQKAGSTCKCTVGNLENDVLQPGESTTITLTWTAESLVPMFGQSATFKTNDPAMAEVKFTVNGQIATSFVVEPSELSLGDVPVDGMVEKFFYVFSYLPELTELEDFRWSKEDTQPYFNFESQLVPIEETPYERHRSAFSAHKVKVTVSRGLPMGPLNGRLSFRTGLQEKVGRLDLLITGRGVSDVSLIGGSSFDPELSLLRLGAVDSAKGATAGVVLSIQGADMDSIKPEIESWNPQESMRVTLSEPRKSANRMLYTVQVEVPKGAPEAYYPGTGKGTFGKIVIKTNHPTIREVPIYVQLVVKK
jgi:hypothetical protein